MAIVFGREKQKHRKPVAKCLEHAYNMRTTCVQHAYNMRTTCVQPAEKKNNMLTIFNNMRTTCGILNTRNRKTLIGKILPPKHADYFEKLQKTRSKNPRTLTTTHKNFMEGTQSPKYGRQHGSRRSMYHYAGRGPTACPLKTNNQTTAQR